MIVRQLLTRVMNEVKLPPARLLMREHQCDRDHRDDEGVFNDLGAVFFDGERADGIEKFVHDLPMK